MRSVNQGIALPGRGGPQGCGKGQIEAFACPACSLALLVLLIAREESESVKEREELMRTIADVRETAFPSGLELSWHKLYLASKYTPIRITIMPATFVVVIDS